MFSWWVVEEIVKGILYFSQVEMKERGKQAWSEPIVSSTIKERLSSWDRERKWVMFLSFFFFGSSFCCQYLDLNLTGSERINHLLGFLKTLWRVIGGILSSSAPKYFYQYPDFARSSRDVASYCKRGSSGGIGRRIRILDLGRLLGYHIGRGRGRVSKSGERLSIGEWEQAEEASHGLFPNWVQTPHIPTNLFVDGFNFNRRFSKLYVDCKGHEAGIFGKPLVGDEGKTLK